MEEINKLELQINDLTKERDNIISKMTVLTLEDLTRLNDIDTTLFELRNKLNYVKTNK